MRRTKIIATVGPSSESEETLKRMDEFVDMYRINSSHNSIEECREKIRKIRRVSEKPVFVDLKGPKIRTKKFESEFTVNHGDVLNYEDVGIFVDGKDVGYVLKDGLRVLVDDGKMEFLFKDGKFHVIKGGTLFGSKGVFVPGAKWRIDNPTETDMEYVRELKDEVDGFAISFVNSADDVRRLRDVVGNKIIIPKIETQEGVNNISRISEESDIIMVARGDLGVEVGIENLPKIQEMLVSEIKRKEKPFIIATQVAQSMVSSRIPTRAEVSDVYLSVLQGADMIMFSNETAVGEDPVNTVRIARKIIDGLDIRPSLLPPSNGLTYSLARHAVEISESAGADALFVLTRTGLTAESISIFKPPVPVFAFSTDDFVVRKMNMYYGVVPGKISSPDEIYDRIKSSGFGRVVFVAGSGFSIDKTDTIQFIRN